MIKLDDVIYFCKSRNDSWKNISESRLAEIFLLLKNNIFVFIYNDCVKCVAVFTEFENEICFLSITADENINAYKIIRNLSKYAMKKFNKDISYMDRQLKKRYLCHR